MAATLRSTCSMIALCLIHLSIALADQQQAQPIKVLLISVPLAGHAYSVLAVGEELVRKGHNVTFCSLENWFDMRAKSIERGINYLSAGKFNIESEIVMREILIEQKNGFASMNPLVYYQTLTDTFGMMNNFSEPIAKYLMLKENLHDFDIIVADQIHLALSCVASHEGIPFVLIADVALGLSPWSHPPLFSRQSNDLDFLGRLRSSLSYTLQFIFGLDVVFVFTHNGGIAASICEKTMLPFPIHDYPILVRTVIGLDYPQGLLPLTQHVGPLLSQRNKSLSSDLSQWLENKEEKSVIYISMGSIVSVDVAIAKAFIEGIRNTKYSVIWSLSKANQDILSSISFDTKQYFISSWIPQVTLLQHNSIGIAILHGGANGINEALRFGVPCIVVPQIGDQHDWAKRVVQAGVGLQIPRFYLITSTVIKESIEKIESGDYRDKANKMKLIMEKAGGVGKARELIEFYATVGYDHLLPAPVKYRWSWIQYYNVDVKITFLCLFIACVYFLMRMCQCCCRKRKQKQP